MTLLALFLFSGVITEDFLVDTDSVRGYQVQPNVAVAPNGNFAVAWVDSLTSEEFFAYRFLRLRFFDKKGEAITEPLLLSQDSIVGSPALALSNNRIMCIWYEGKTHFVWSLYGRIFDTYGNPLTDRLLLVEDDLAKHKFAITSSQQGGFFIVWSWGSIYGQRYDSLGNSLGSNFEVYSPEKLQIWNLGTGANANGRAVVFWTVAFDPNDNYLCYQIVDSANNLVIRDSFSRVSKDPDDYWLQRRARVRWLDDERFAIFWLKTDWGVGSVNGVQARLYNVQGDSISETKTLLDDEYAAAPFSTHPLSVSSVHEGRYAVGYMRRLDGPEAELFLYHRAAGFLADTSLNRSSGIFRLSETEPHYYQQEDRTSVDACSDRVVWVWQDNSGMREHDDPENIDPYYTDVHCKITDWDIEGVAEQPIIRESPIRLEATINRLSYDLSGEAELTLYSADGRRVLSETIKGKGTWTPSSQLPSGVYFARVSSGDHSATGKVIVIR